MKYWIIGSAGAAVALAIASYGFWQSSQSFDAQQAVGYAFALIIGAVGGCLFSAFLLSLWVLATKARSLVSPRQAAGAADLEWPLAVLALCAIILIPLFGFCCVRSAIELRTANNSHASPAVLWKIGESAIRRNNHKLLFSLANNPATPPEMFPLLLATDHDAVKGALIRNPNINSGILTTLAEDRNSHVRALVATSPKLSDVMLNKLASSDPDAHVREIARYWEQTREKK
jgi:hypothetical protein